VDEKLVAPHILDSSQYNLSLFTILSYYLFYLSQQSVHLSQQSKQCPIGATNG